MLSLAIIVGTGLVVRAVHDAGVFELEGNAVTDNPAPSHDWDLVYQDSLTNPKGTSAGATAVSFASEPNLNTTIFQGGGSKDPIDVDQWAWKDEAGGLPDKDNLLDSFAARYSLPATDPATWVPGTPFCGNGTGGPNQPTFNPAIKCELLFFGSDRYDNSGDAQQGFWFFQNEITLGTNSVGGGTGFNGVHKAGDLLVISDFSNGGTTSTITIYKWDPVRQVNGLWVGCVATNKAVKPDNPTKTITDGNCGDANLRRLETSDAAKCGPSLSRDPFCGIVNPANGTVSPWPFLDKSGNTTFANGEFYEGGVNLTLLGLSGECFASVASETRSSTSTTAVLKDFVLGSFARCDSGMQTTPQTVAIDGTTGTDITGNVSIGTGTVLVRDKAVLQISGVQSWTGTVDFRLCGPADLAPTPGVTQTTCATGGTLIGDDIAASNGPSATTIFSPNATVTSVGKYCWRAEFTSTTPGVPNASDAAITECFTVVPVNPAITTDASADAPGVAIGVPINDIATLSGAASQPAIPVINTTGTAGAAAGGSITFRLYGPADTTCTGTPVYTNTVTVTGNGNYNSGNYTPTAAGTYRWIASYTGNGPNTNGPVAGACGDTNEVSVVQTNPTSIITVATGAAGLPLGSAISDTATLSGATATAGGTITFRAYGPDDASCSGTVVFTSAAIAVSGPGNYGSGSFTPTAAGVYRWTVSYSGDANNEASSGACNAANESSLITSLRITTSQFFYPNDSATITAVGGSNLEGTIRFRVYTNSGCTGTPVYDSGALSATTAAGVLTKTVSTANIANSVAGNVTVYWLVEFDSTNPQHADLNLACGDERTQLIVTDKQ